MRRKISIILIITGFLLLGLGLQNQSNATEVKTQAAPAPVLVGPSCVLEAQVDGTIGPATLDFIKRAKLRAEQQSCGAILLLVNTPGGNLQSTRMIVEEILNSPRPFLCFIYPAGGHAGSAGAIILQACHVAGAVEATNIGAATPISSSGENMPEDLRKKILNDTRSWVEGLAKLRNRSETFAKEIVEEAKALSATDALKAKAIDFVGNTKEEFLKFAEGRTVELAENKTSMIAITETHPFDHDLRYKIMDVLMNPQVAYIMFMGSLGLLYFEVTHPGMIAPGVVGGLGLILSLVSLHMLEVTWGGLLLIIVGIVFMIAEAFTAGFGLLGIGGMFAFFIGSIFLFDPEQSGYVLPLSIVLPTIFVVGAVMLGFAYLALTARRQRHRVHASLGEILNHFGVVSEVHPGDGTFGMIYIAGETWRVTSRYPLRVGDKVKVISNQGLTLQVEPQQLNFIEENEEEI